MKKKSPYLPFFIIGGALVLGFFLISSGSSINNGGRSSYLAGQPQAQQQANISDTSRLKELEGDNPTLGDPNAPVTLVEFGDYQCTFCTRFFKETEPALIEKYVNTGKLKIVFRDLPINGSESQNAAEAAACADEQGEFWSYHDKLYDERRGYQAGVFTDDNLKIFAGQLDLNREQFDSCYDSGKYRDAIRDDARAAARFGARGTPNFFLNGRQIVGAQPLYIFEGLIEEALLKAI